MDEGWDMLELLIGDTDTCDKVCCGFGMSFLNPCVVHVWSYMSNNLANLVALPFSS